MISQSLHELVFQLLPGRLRRNTDSICPFLRSEEGLSFNPFFEVKALGYRMVIVSSTNLDH